MDLINSQSMRFWNYFFNFWNSNKSIQYEALEIRYQMLTLYISLFKKKLSNSFRKKNIHKFLNYRHTIHRDLNIQFFTPHSPNILYTFYRIFFLPLHHLSLYLRPFPKLKLSSLSRLNLTFFLRQIIPLHIYP